ncbi:hypothetical protein J2W88_003912 [Acidovorax delafieldii]|uniref:Uncharacterized protein n=1 Tax=Acidovorax delafieldii TaxID=47920 RepID=A0AAJ2BW65_ACIDE|nr:hypothetical protein [Acidovorax delafieldii]MDR6768608.1 hypothetical protein [Acidovorax delafieldii]MDR6837323.1 hypothetical protein [Acidovorax delafieldii]MDR7366814.1 hypothetical protein [Acidovorax delafieldii]
MDVRLPDGTIIQNVPDGTTKADLVAKLQGNGMAVPSEWLQAAPAAQPVKDAGQSINRGISDIPRQIGLTARYALEGPAQAAQIFTEPVAGLMRAAGIKTKPLGEIASGFADTVGLPKPETSQERVVGDATRLLAGTGGMLGASRAVAQLPGMVGTVGAGMAANPTAQLTGAVGAGTMGGLSREGGGNEMQQAGAALIGGVAGGMVPGAANAAVNAGKRLFNQLTPQQMDVQISNVLQRAGMDYSQVPERARQSLRTQMQDALRAGQELDPAAVRRLAEFQTIGATPTRGMVTQDPVRITQEMNLAKMGANSADGGLQGLARVQNQNNARLIDVMNESGANRGDPFRAGQQAIGAIQGRDADMASRVTSLYQQARDTSGRAADLDRVAFSTRVSELLDDAMVGGALPKDVESMVNWIANNAKPQGMHGSIPMPFNVDIAEQLKTRIATLQRNTSDGSARHALGLVRQALDETPLMSAPTVNPGNLPSVPGTVPPSPMQLGQESINAFNEARNAARQRFGWQESARPIEAALNGAQPDKFVENFVIRGSVADASAVARNAPTEEVKNAILAHLKEKSLGGAADEVGKFSQSAYNKALNQIGDRKLALFFTPEEVNQLRTVGRVASYMQNQPVGSAVNNSNSGALLLGKGLDVLNSIPVIGPLAGPALQNINITMQQRAAQNVAPGLLAIQPRQPLASGLLNPALGFSGGLLSAPPVN